MSHIPRLLLKRVHCVRDTDENGGESPYFLVTVGQRGPQPRLFMAKVRVPEWDNAFNKDTRLSTNTLAASRELAGCPDLSTSTLVLVTMLEEDDSADIDGGTLSFLRTFLSAQWLVYGGSTWAGASLQNVGEMMSIRVRAMVEGVLGNDDYMGTRRLQLSTSDGDLDLLSFSGDDGLYRVRFANEGLSA